MRHRRISTWSFLRLVLLLLTPHIAEAAPNLTGKQLSLDWTDPRKEMARHVRPGVYRSTQIVVEAGVPGGPIRARLLNPTDSDTKFCGTDAHYIGTYATGGAIEMRLATPGHAYNAPCTGKYHHQLNLRIGRSGEVSGTWFYGAGGLGGEPKPVSGRCINCEAGGTNWTTPAMIIAAIIALLLFVAYQKGTQIEAAKRAAAPAAAKRVPERDEGPSFDGLELTEAGARAEQAARRRRAEEMAALARRVADEAAKKQAAEEALRRKAAAEMAKRKSAEDTAKRRAAEDKAKRKAVEEAAKQAEARKAIEVERERLRHRLVKAGKDLLSGVSDPERRRFYETFLKRHEDDAGKLRLAIDAVRKQMDAEGDRAASDAEWLGGFEKTAVDIKEWSARANRVLALGVPGAGQILGLQGVALGIASAAEQGGVTGVGKHILRTGADMVTGGMATKLYDNNGNLIQALGEKAAENDPREYLKRLRAAKKRFDKGEWAEAAGEALDTALDAGDSASDANRMRKNASNVLSGGVGPAGIGAVKKVHGNDIDNSNPHHVYEIHDRKNPGTPHKTGISDESLNRKSESPRAKRQLKKLNDKHPVKAGEPERFTHVIVAKDLPNRRAALSTEQHWVNLQNNRDGRPGPGNARPKPNQLLGPLARDPKPRGARKPKP